MVSVFRKSSAPRLNHPVQLTFSVLKHQKETSRYASASDIQDNILLLAYIERKAPVKCFFCHTRHAIDIYSKLAVYRSQISDSTPVMPHVPLTYHYHVYVRMPMEDLLSIASVIWTPPHMGSTPTKTPWNLLVTNVTAHQEWSLSCLQTVYIP
jgi:hypothetical protein